MIVCLFVKKFRQFVFRYFDLRLFHNPVEWHPNCFLQIVDSLHLAAYDMMPSLLLVMMMTSMRLCQCHA